MNQCCRNCVIYINRGCDLARRSASNNYDGINGVFKLNPIDKQRLKWANNPDEPNDCPSWKEKK